MHMHSMIFFQYENVPQNIITIKPTTTQMHTTTSHHEKGQANCVQRSREAEHNSKKRREKKTRRMKSKH